MKKRIIPVLLLAAVAAAAFYFYFYPDWFNGEPANHRLMVSGNIEASEALLSFQVPGRVDVLTFEEGAWVEKGAVLARLDDADYAQQVALDQANLRVAQAQLDLALAGARPQEIAAAEHTIREAEARLERRKLELERAKALYRKDAGSKQALDAAGTDWKQAEAALKRARTVRDQLVEGARKEEIAIARAIVIRAREVLRFSRIRLEQAVLRAPSNGVVLVKQADVGEVVAPGSPILTLGDLDNVWLRAYIAETDLGRVRWGQEVSLQTDTFPDKIYRGRISFISSRAEFTPKSIETHQERVKLVYRIKISVENPNQELKPGMPADALIHTDSEVVTAADPSDPE